jgi:hypothetical protein
LVKYFEIDQKPFKNVRLLSDGFWNGYWDEPHEGTFVDVNSGKAVGAYQPWYFGEPNGDTIENCAMVWPARNAWNDLACSNKRCSFCYMSVAPYLNFRGKEPSSPTSKSTKHSRYCNIGPSRSGWWTRSPDMFYSISHHILTANI